MDVQFAKPNVDVDLLWRDVVKLVDETNKMMAMVFLIEGKIRGIGYLQMAGSNAIARIYMGKET